MSKQSAKNKGRNVVDLDHEINDITSRVMQIDYWKKTNTDSLPALPGTHQIARPKASSHTRSVKEKQYKRAATHVCNELYNSKSKNKENKLTLNTFHKYLTKIKNSIRLNVARHNPELPEIVSALSKKYPAYSALISQLITDDKKYVSKVKSHILKELSQLDKVDADNLHAEISNLSKNGEIEHPIIKHLSLTEAQQQRRKDEISARLKERKTNKQSYTMGFISRVTDECLDSDNFNDLAVGIALATGRRAVEVIYRGKFSATGEHTIMFSGQAKKGRGVEPEAYVIPTLKKADTIINAVEKLRSTDRYSTIISELSEVPENEKNTQINIKCARMLNYTVKNKLQPKKEQKDSNVMFKDCRVIALQAAILKIMPRDEYKSLDINEFVLRFQGHDDYEEFANYQHIAVTDEEEVIQPEPEIKPTAKAGNIDLSALNGIDDVINSMGKKTIYKLHNRVKEWANRTGAEINQTALYKGVNGDKAGGSLALIKVYLATPEAAKAVASHNKKLTRGNK